MRNVDWIASDSDQGPVAESCERDNEPSGSIKGEEFDQLSNYWLLKRDSAP